MERELMKMVESRECPRLQTITRVAGPAYNSRRNEPAQGAYLWCQHLLTYGDAQQLGAPS